MIEDVADFIRESKDANRARWIGVFIAVLAVLLSIASMIGEDTDKAAAKANLDATNTWAFFQAKNIRKQQYEIAADNLKLQLASNANLPADARSQIEERLDKYQKKAARYRSEPDKKEGLKELIVRAKAHEAKRDQALKRGPYLDYGEAFLQIAIVLASVAIVTGVVGILLLSVVVAAAGVLYAANGVFMFTALPFVL